MKQLFLIDGSGYIFRAYHALPPLTAPDGTPVGAVYGFCNMLRNLISSHRMHHFLVVFDAGRQTFRQEIYPDYKAHRPPAPDDLVPQFPLILEACQAFGVPMVQMQGYEADDLIASYARKAKVQGFDVTIVSADKDLMQLVEDKIKLYDPMKRKDIGVDQVREKFGVDPSKVIDVQALAGDSSDNVPGVPGIGIKTAAELITTYGTLEMLLAGAQKIKQPKRRQSLIDNAEKARISKKLVTLVDTLDLPLDFDSLFVRDLSKDTLVFLEKMGFKNLLARVTSEVAQLHGSAYVKNETIVVGNSQIEKTNIEYKKLVTKEEIVTFLYNATLSGIAAFDTETTSLHIHSAKMVGCSIAYRDSNDKIQAAYIPFHHVTSDAQASFAEIKPELSQFLLQKGVLKVGHNLKYDMEILKLYNLKIESYEDTLLMSYCLNGGLHSHSMDFLAKTYLNRETISFESVCGSGKNQITFDRVPLDTATSYAAEDAEITLMLYEFFKPQLLGQKVSSLYYDVERPLLPSIVEMEYTGVKVDPMVLSKIGIDLNTRLNTLQHDIFKDVGHEFNIGSPKQLGVVLFEEQNMPAPKMTKTGIYTTDADVLESLVQKGYDLPRKILEWRSLTKLLTTYVESLQKAIHPVTHRVHTSYALSGTSTGRLSSSDPNLQNIPIKTEDGRRIRQAFVPQDGWTMVSFDYSQIELRLLAHFADVPALTEAFQQDIDSHKATACILFDVPYDEVTPEQRRQAKTVNFGIIYGISAYGLSNQLLMTQSQAAALIKSYMERYPGVDAFMKQKKDEAALQGYVTTISGRKCYTPGIHDRNSAIRNFAERQAINAPLQGSNADIIKKAMIQIYNWLQQSKIEAHMLLQVHDELVFEVKNDPLIIEKLVNEVRQIMENVITLSVPLKVDVGIGENWDAAHS